jgi:hypothetical protein
VEGSSFRLEYILYSPHPNLYLTGIPAYSVEVKRRELSKLRKRLEIVLLQDQHKDLQSGLNILGYELYNLLFSRGEGGLASLYDRISDDIESWLILDDTEPWIPWELVKPHGSGWEHDFLGQRYSLGRWVEGWGAVRESECPLGQVNYTQESGLSQSDTSVRSCLIGTGEIPKLDGCLFVDWLGGYQAAMDYRSPVWWLHFEGYVGSLRRRLENLMLTDSKSLSTEDVEDHWLNFRRKAPLVAFGQLRLKGRTALTEVETRWLPTFVKAGASAFVSVLWAVDPQIDRLFWRTFYKSIWQRTPLGRAVQEARHLVHQAFPHSADWLAYFLVGDPMTQGYVPRQGEGYTTLECMNHDLEQPLKVGKPYVFRATLRDKPPPWYHGRRYKTPEIGWDNPQVLVFAQSFDIRPGMFLPFGVPTGDLYSRTFEVIPEEIGTHDIFVKFTDGNEVRHTVAFSVEVVSGKVEQ